MDVIRKEFVRRLLACLEARSSHSENFGRTFVAHRSEKAMAEAELSRCGSGRQCVPTSVAEKNENTKHELTTTTRTSSHPSSEPLGFVENMCVALQRRPWKADRSDDLFVNRSFSKSNERRNLTLCIFVVRGSSCVCANLDGDFA